jgi:hypothetical protein
VAGDWIKIRNDLDEDPHVLRLQELLGNPDIDLVVGKLRRLWKYADRFTVDGRIIFADEARIDGIVSFAGFAAALRSVGWLEFDGSGAVIPRFDEHNGESAKRRSMNTFRQQTSRRRRADVALKRDKSATREEKRREEKNQGVTPPETPVAANESPPAGNRSETAPTPSDNRPSETARTPSDRTQPTTKPRLGNRSETAPTPSDNRPSETARTPSDRTQPTTKPRPRDELFDAVAEVTASDPKVSGSYIGRVCKLLRTADPPYTPDEVRRWAELVRRQWSHEGPPTLGMIEKHIGRVRAPQTSAKPKRGATSGQQQCLRFQAGARYDT